MVEREINPNRLRRKTATSLMVGGAAGIIIGVGAILGAAGPKVVAKTPETNEYAQRLPFDSTTASVFVGGVIAASAGIVTLAGGTVLLSLTPRR